MIKTAKKEKTVQRERDEEAKNEKKKIKMK